MNCKLPWTSRRAKELQNCTTSDHLMTFQAVSMNLMYMGEAQYYNVTQCMNPCKYYYYRSKEVRIDIKC